MTAQAIPITVSKRLAASPERAFDAWLSPELIGQWMFGPHLRDEEIVSLSLESRVGGTFSFVVRRGGTDFDHVGEYLVLDRPRQLGFTWGMRGADSSRVSVDFEPLDTGCEVTLTHELHPDWADFASRTAEGWQTLLNALARRLEG